MLSLSLFRYMMDRNAGKGMGNCVVIWSKSASVRFVNSYIRLGLNQQKKKTAQGVKVATVPIKFKSDRFNVVNGSASFDGGFYQKFYIKSFYYE